MGGQVKIWDHKRTMSLAPHVPASEATGARWQILTSPQVRPIALKHVLSADWSDQANGWGGPPMRD